MTDLIHSPEKIKLYKSLDERLANSFGLSPDARSWVLRALHPAHGHKTMGIPDEQSSPVLRPDYRVQTVITCPAGAPSWDCLIVSFPGDVNAAYYITGEAGTDFSTPVPPTTPYELGVLRQQPCGVDPAITNSFTRLANGEDSINSTDYWPDSNPAGFRHQYRSLTAHLVASAVSDQGSVYAAQYAPVFADGGLLLTNLPSGSGTSSVLVKTSTCVMPYNETDLAATAPKYYANSAREGVYMPMNLAGPSQPFARSVQGTPIAQSINDGPYYANVDRTRYPVSSICVPLSYEPGLAGSYGTPWWAQALVNPGSLSSSFYSPVIGLDSAFDNCNIGVVIFRGLNGAGSGGGFASSINLKCFSGLEVRPQATAADRVYLESPAMYEPRALQAYYAMALELNDAYPARYNSFGDLLEKIAGVAQKVWSVVSPVLKHVAPIAAPAIAGFLGGPGASMVASKAVGPVLQTLDTLMDIADRPVVKYAQGVQREEGRTRDSSRPRLTVTHPSSSSSSSATTYKLAKQPSVFVSSSKEGPVKTTRRKMRA